MSLLAAAPALVKALRRHTKSEDVALSGLLCLCNLSACAEGQVRGAGHAKEALFALCVCVAVVVTTKGCLGC